MSNRDVHSIVTYFSSSSGNKCGYCQHTDTSISTGMWAHRLTVNDYQSLIDRGWRRSGKYTYKPSMDKTCCPQYTIKCVAGDFKLNKSHKKAIKRFNRYINTGQGEKDIRHGSPNGVAEMNNVVPDHVEPTQDELQGDIDMSRVQNSPKAVCDQLTGEGSSISGSPPSLTAVTSSSGSSLEKFVSCENVVEMVATVKMKAPKQGDGADPNRPVCQKAKDRRKEHWLQKQASRGEPQAKTVKPNVTGKDLEQLLNEIIVDSKHKFEVRLVRSSPRSDQFNSSYEESYAVYKRYQMAIHGDPPEKPSERQFTNFLVESPLQPSYTEGGFEDGYGSFHQQYLIDGRIIAVGVIDILPSCVSSVYLYYDPDYAFLSIGTYSALQELAFIRKLCTMEPCVKNYYMGFYIHSCPKMRYKGQYVPSFILCPETYNWLPIEKCRPKLDEKKYCRLQESMEAEDEESPIDVNEVLVLWERQALPFQLYAVINPDNEDKDEVIEYSQLVGRTCSQRMLLVRS